MTVAIPRDGHFFYEASAGLPAFICAAIRSVLVILGEASDETYCWGRALHYSDHRPNQHSLSAVLLWFTRWHLSGFTSCPDGTSWSILLLWVVCWHLQSAPCSAAAISRRRLHSASCYSGRPAGLRTNQKWLVPTRRSLRRKRGPTKAPRLGLSVACAAE